MRDNELLGLANRYLAGRNAEARYASFDYCYNHFQAARETGTTPRLATGDQLLRSCLQLGFYLASWGMMRGSGDLLQRSLRGLVPVVELVAHEHARSWELGPDGYAEDAGEVLELAERIRGSFTITASDILLTKTMLGIFGCVPAFDRFFRKGFGCHTLCRAALDRIGAFYTGHRTAIDAIEVYTHDFYSGDYTTRRYPAAKVIDMAFFQKGLES